MQKLAETFEFFKDICLTNFFNRIMLFSQFVDTNFKYFCIQKFLAQTKSPTKITKSFNFKHVLTMFSELKIYPKF